MEPLKTIETLQIGDLADHLAKLAAVEQDERTGNLPLSNGLRLLADCLRREKSRPLSDLAELRLKRIEPKARPLRKPEIELPKHLNTLKCEEVIAIIDNERFQKKQLIELGHRRLGIPSSRLSRLNRADAIDLIRATLDNERTLETLGRHARLTGARRSG